MEGLAESTPRVRPTERQAAEMGLPAGAEPPLRKRQKPLKKAKAVPQPQPRPQTRDLPTRAAARAEHSWARTPRPKAEQSHQPSQSLPAATTPRNPR